MDHTERENQRQEDRITALEESMKRIEKMLTPISETYTTVSFLGKWVMASAVFISIVIGILIGIKSLK